MEWASRWVPNIPVHTLADAKLHYTIPQPRECVQLSSSQNEAEYEQVDESAETGFTITTNIAYTTVNIWLNALYRD